MGKQCKKMPASGRVTCPHCDIERACSQFDRANKHGVPVGWCKSCQKKYSQRYYQENREDRIATTERWREKNTMTEDYRTGRREYARRYRAANPARTKAQTRVTTEIHAGRLLPQPCILCGDKGVAHHEDYSKPLEIIWLCITHHMSLHRAPPSIYL